jgi:23S rRNA pseudouridine955/2504/2580 synthase
MIELPISKQPGTGGEKMMVDESGEGQSARTRYRVIEPRGQFGRMG